MASFGLPPASMGFVGAVQLIMSGIQGNPLNLQVYQLRANSCDLNLRQEIVKPNVIDVLYDRNVFQPKPQQIEGSIEYTVIMGDVTASGDVTPSLWAYTTKRNNLGRLYPFNVNVAYGPSAIFRFIDCYVNSFTYSVRQGEAIKVKTNLMAMDRIESNFEIFKKGNSRVATWNDAFCNIRTQDFQIESGFVRAFDVEVSNNLERFFTAGGPRLLRAQDISPRIRDINGSVTLMGRHLWLANYALNNPARCRESAVFEFGHNIACSFEGGGSFVAPIPNVIFMVEEIQLTQDLLETIIKWQAVPADNKLYGVVQSFIF